MLLIYENIPLLTLIFEYDNFQVFQHGFQCLILSGGLLIGSNIGTDDQRHAFLMKIMKGIDVGLKYVPNG